jgi:NAD(P)-dependent dehydrogenase (short-subunit alcohol dehydrogenase family)
MKTFLNAVAVVTGAGSGIGRAIALRLSQEGAIVHCVDRNLANAVAVAGECANGTAHQVDVTDVADVEALANRIFAAGPVDILINNAGIAHSGTILDSEVNDFRRLLEVNVMGVVHGLHAFLPRMLAQQTPAHIVNTASGAGLFASPGIGPYCASKHAVVGLSSVLAAELHDTPIAVTILCPGIVNTPIIQTAAFRGAAGDRRAKTIEFYARRAATPESVADDLVRDMKRGKLFCLSRKLEVGLGWWLHRLSPTLALGVSRRLLAKLQQA